MKSTLPGAPQPSLQRPNARPVLRDSEMEDKDKLRRKLNDVVTQQQRDAVDVYALKGMLVDYNLSNWVSGSSYSYSDLRLPFTPRGLCVVFVEQENNPQQAFGSAIPLVWKPKSGGAQIVSMAFPTSNRNYHVRFLALK